MAVTDADLGELQKQVQALSAEVALRKRSSSWWHQFSSTALPIVITLFITVLGAVALQNSRFESIEGRVATVETDMKQLLAAQSAVQATQSAMQKGIAALQQDMGVLKQDVGTLKQAVGSLQAEVKDIKDLLTRAG